MAYERNDRNNAPPAAIKQEITPWIPVVQEMTENKWTDNQVRLIWNNQPNAMTPDDFLRMMYIAAKRGLDPLLRQIYATCRFSSREQKYSTTIESTIDGFRLASDRTGDVEGMSAPEFTYIAAQDGSQILHSCTITLYRRGCPQGFTATVFLSEFCQTNFQGQPTEMWRKMPHQMLSKCCEAVVRRMAFPAALSGIYSKEEMMQADNVTPLSPSYIGKETAVAPAPLPVAVAQPPASAPITEAPVPSSPPAQATVLADQQTETQKTRRRRTAEPAPAPAPTLVQPPPVEAPIIQTTFAPPAMLQAPVPPPPAPPQPGDKYVCADTGKPITNWTDPGSGQTYDRDWLYEYSVRQLGRPLCAERMLAVKTESTQPPPQVIANQAAQILNGTAA
jgi:phage recombination protein Bet